MNTVVVACSEPGFAAPESGAWVIDELCQNPGQLTTRGDIDRLVLVLHQGRFDLSSVQKAARTMGIDPLGVQIFEAGPGDFDAPTAAGLEGLVSRASAFEGSRPEQAKPSVPREMTRRSFLYPPVTEYTGAPFIERGRCASSSGCRACVDVCPQDAYVWRDGDVHFDLDVCMPCGRCVTTCPTGAISNPTVSPAMIHSQITAIVESSDGPIGVRFVCERGSIEADPAFENVFVPCTSMVPATWIVASLLAGASEAAAVPCRHSGCPLGLDAHAIAANRLAEDVLRSVGLDGGDVAGLDSQGNAEGVRWFGPGGGPELIETLADSTGSRVSVLDDSAPIGIVAIEPAVCTLCGQCAKICPTGALMEAYDDERVRISFDPRLCVNCSQCTSTCPEFERGAIRVQGGFDSRALAGGPKTLVEAPVSNCEICGEAFAPTSMMDRVAELLGPEYGSTMALIGSRCLDCRGR